MHFYDIIEIDFLVGMAIFYTLYPYTSFQYPLE